MSSNEKKLIQVGCQVWREKIFKNFTRSLNGVLEAYWRRVFGSWGHKAMKFVRAIYSLGIYAYEVSFAMSLLIIKETIVFQVKAKVSLNLA